MVMAPRRFPRHARRQWHAVLKSVAAIVTLGLIVFLKLDRVAERWFASHRANPSDGGAPLPAASAKPAPVVAKVIDSLSLREHCSFTPEELREFPDLNFQFRMPDDAWDFIRDPWSREGGVFGLTKVTAKSGVHDEISEAQFTLRVLPMGLEAGSDQNHAAAAVQASLQALGGGCRIRGREDVRVNGMLFSRMEIEDLHLEHGRTNAEVWLYALNGMVYEMLTAMPDRTPPYYLGQTARRLVEGFSIINPSRVLRSAEVLALLETAGSAPVPATGCSYGNVSITLKPDTWSTWPGAKNTLPGTALAFTSRSGLRMAAAFTPAEGLPEDMARTTSLIGLIWPAVRDFQWGGGAARLHDGQRALQLRGTGMLNSRTGRAELRAVRCGKSLMVLFAFGPGDAREDVLAANLDRFRVKPSANGDPDFGLIEERDFHRNVLAALAEDATANGRHEEACEYHRTLFEWDRRPDDLCNASRSLAAAGKKEDALRLIADNEGRHAGEPEWEAKKMLLLASIGQAAESRRVAAGLLKSGGLAASAAAVYVETLIEARSFPEAQSFVTMLTEIDQSPVWHLYRALLMAETGERSKAAAVVRAVRSATPGDVDLSVECVNVLMRCRLFPEALELARFLALKNPQREQMQILAAACHTALGHTAEARDAYQKVLDLNPGSVTARDAISSLAASSGQEGTDDIVSANIPAVALPAGLAAKLPKPSALLTDTGGQSAVHLYRVTGLQLHTSQPLRQTVRGAIRILDEEGMSLFNTMRFPVQPQAQRLCIHYLRVLNAAGVIAGSASLSEHYSLDGAASGVATSGKVIHVPVPGLTPGCTIEYAYTIENTGSTGAIEYTRHVFALPEPCRLDTWFITGDTARLKFASSRGREPDRDGDSLVWMEPQPAVLTNSLLQSNDADSLPVLHAGTPSTSWEKLGSDYLDQIRDRLATNPAVTRAAQDAIAGLRTREERINALAALVRDSISYTAIEFGARAIIPNPAAATLTNRYGDCKDHAVLLHQLLTAAAIPSHLCLINSRGSIQRDFPCISQFDHMIVALPIPGGKTCDFIDPTNKYLVSSPLSAPPGLESRSALILDPAAPFLADTPANSPPSEIDTRRDIEIRGDEDAVLRDTISLTGSRAARLRALLAPLSPLERTATLRQLIGFDRLSQHVTDLRIQNIKELAAPLRIVIQWEARRCLRRVDGNLRLTLPTVIESHLLTADTGSDADGTDTPLRLTSPVHIHSVATLHLPAGHTLSPQSLTPADATSAFGAWSVRISPPDAVRIARITWDCTLKPATLPPDKKRPFIDFTHDSLRRLQGDWEFVGESVVQK